MPDETPEVKVEEETKDVVEVTELDEFSEFDGVFGGENTDEVETAPDPEALSEPEKDPKVEEGKEVKPAESEVVKEKKGEVVTAPPKGSEKDSPEKVKADAEAKVKADAKVAEDAEKTHIEVELESRLKTTEERRVATTKWANGLSQELATSKRYAALLERRVANPRFDPTTDPEYIAQQKQKATTDSTTKIRSELSLKSANDKFGADEVTKFVERYKEKFGDDQATRMRILESESPVEAAIEMVEMADFFDEWGETPAKIVEAITKKALAEATPKLRVEERKRILAEIKKTGKVSSGLRSMRGTDADAAPKDTPTGEKNLDAIFGND